MKGLLEANTSIFAIKRKHRNGSKMNSETMQQLVCCVPSQIHNQQLFMMDDLVTSAFWLLDEAMNAAPFFYKSEQTCTLPSLDGCDGQGQDTETTMRGQLS